MTSGDVNDDSEPLTLKAHAPLQIENVDMRIDILKAYLIKSPDAKIKDLKKSLVGFSKYTEDEFKDLIKSASPEKYNELYPVTIPHERKIAGVKRGGSVERYTKEEVDFLELHRNESRKDVYKIYKREFPTSPRKLQFLYDYYHQNPTGPSKSKFHSTIQRVTTQQTNHIVNHHILAQAIDALYKSGKSPKVFSQIKPVIELIKDPNEVNFAIECLTS